MFSTIAGVGGENYFGEKEYSFKYEWKIFNFF